MDELNLQEIEKKLNTEYQSGQRMVFWYDAESSFEDEVDQLNLPGVQIVPSIGEKCISCKDIDRT